MLEAISKGFRNARNRLKGFREITPESVDDAVRDIRVSLLEADVQYHVVKAFLERVKEKALGEIVQTKVKHKGETLKVTPGDHFVRVCQEELEALMGPVDVGLRYAPVGITKIMLVGLQGSGKTTTAAKLANYLVRKERRPMLVAADIYRPAAVQQLQVLGERLGLPVFHEPGVAPPELCQHAIPAAREAHCDTLIFDTAGRLAIDEPLMQELEQIAVRTAVDNILLVVDAMIGQDSVRTGSAFNERLQLDGFVLTKLDGDARGGAALSLKAVTGKPIKFLGMGEGNDALEEFRPEGLASRILGMGDIVGLMQDFEQHVDERKAEEEAERLMKGEFNLLDFLDQIRTIRKMGSLKDLLEKMPFFGDAIPEGMNLDDRELVKVEAIIQSMTNQERLRPQLIDERRAARIAAGSGRKLQEVADLLHRFGAMKDMMSKISRQPGLLAHIPGFKQLAQMKQLRGMDLSQVFGDMKAGPGGMPGAGPADAKKKKVQRLFDREKQRRKAKLAKKARKKNR